MSSVFRGFVSECQAVRAVLAESVSPDLPARAVLITGSVGAGKTRMLRETAAMAGQLGFPTRAAAADGEPDALLKAIEGAESRGGKRLLVTLDDIEQAHPARVAAAVGVATAGCPGPVVWALAGRVCPAGDAVAWLPGKLRAAAVVVDLVGLDESSALDLVADLAGGRPSCSLAAFAAQAKGNPLLLEALVTGLREEGALSRTDGEVRLLSDRIPRAVEQLIQGWLSRLSDPCRHLLQVAAALSSCEKAQSGTLRIDPAGRGARGGPPWAEEVEEAIAAGILVAHERELVFPNMLVWRVVRRTLPAPVSSAVAWDVLHESGREPGAEPFVGWPAARDQAVGAIDAATPPAAEKAAGEATVLDGNSPVWERLTDTEQMIASLVVRGMTNRQIAAKVFLSPHTVNYHLRRIFRKLGITSRVELAALAGERSGRG